jgi:hypothetical protein
VPVFAYANNRYTWPGLKRFEFWLETRGLFLYAMSWCIYKFNPFHIPTFKPPALMEFYTFPPLYDFLTWDLPIVFCPAIFPLEFLTFDRGPAPDSIAWVLAVVINAPIYYCVGLIVDVVRRRVARAR